jgi:hypothetical protein
MGMLGEEHEMEMWLWENPGAVGIDRWLARQFHTIRGIADLVGEDANGSLVVVEVKAGHSSGLDNRAMLQTCWYAAEIDALLRMTGEAREIRKMVVSSNLFQLDLHWAAVALDISLVTMEMVSGEYRITQHEMNDRYIENMGQAVKRTNKLLAARLTGRGE